MWLLALQPHFCIQKSSHLSLCEKARCHIEAAKMPFRTHTHDSRQHRLSAYLLLTVLPSNMNSLYIVHLESKNVYFASISLLSCNTVYKQSLWRRETARRRSPYTVNYILECSIFILAKD